MGTGRSRAQARSSSLPLTCSMRLTFPSGNLGSVSHADDTRPRNPQQGLSFPSRRTQQSMRYSSGEGATGRFHWKGKEE